MDITVLRKYARVHKIKTKSKVNKEELAASVSRHFANQTVKELDTITCFLYTAHYKGKIFIFVCVFNGFPHPNHLFFCFIRFCLETSITHLINLLFHP